MFFQAKFLIPDPVANDVKYQAAAQPFLVFGLLTTALAVGHVNQLAAAAGLVARAAPAARPASQLAQRQAAPAGRNSDRADSSVKHQD